MAGHQLVASHFDLNIVRMRNDFFRGISLAQPVPLCGIAN